MATILEVDERVRELAGFPNWESPNMAQRLAFIYTVTDTLSKLVAFLGKPHLVDKFPLTVNSSQNEYSVAPDDFAGLFYCTSDRDGHEVEVVNFPNVDLLGVQQTLLQNIASPGQGVEKLGWYGVGDQKRLLPYPQGSADQLTVWYITSQPPRPSIQDAPKILDEFHLGLVAPAVVLAMLHLWHWDGLSLEEQEAKKATMQDANNIWSVAGIAAQQLAFFKERAFNPNITHPQKHLRGHGWRRRRLRRKWLG